MSVPVSLASWTPKCVPACQVPNVPPVGSLSTVIRPRSMTSIAGGTTVPPARTAASALASASLGGEVRRPYRRVVGLHAEHAGDPPAVEQRSRVVAGLGRPDVELPAEQVAVEGARGFDVGGHEVDPAGRSVRPWRVASRHARHRRTGRRQRPGVRVNTGLRAASPAREPGTGRLLIGPSRAGPPVRGRRQLASRRPCGDEQTDASAQAERRPSAAIRTTTFSPGTL